MAIPSSITRFGKTEPFYLQLARGQIENHKHIFKFGFNGDINGTEETIWDAMQQVLAYVYPKDDTKSVKIKDKSSFSIGGKFDLVLRAL